MERVKKSDQKVLFQKNNYAEFLFRLANFSKNNNMVSVIKIKMQTLYYFLFSTAFNYPKYNLCFLKKTYGYKSCVGYSSSYFDIFKNYVQMLEGCI